MALPTQLSKRPVPLQRPPCSIGLRPLTSDVGLVPSILLGVVAWSLWALLARRIAANPKGDIGGGLGWLLLPVATRLFHRLRVQGVEHVPTATQLRQAGRPMIVVANHGAGVDPLLVQDVCGLGGGRDGHFIRWVMSSDMRVQRFDWFWEWVQVIFVSSSPEAKADELRAVKEMLRQLRDGGVLGIFPEGAIALPAGVLLPFRPGVGTLVAKSGALVLPLIIQDTRPGKTAWHSLLIPGRPRVRVMPVIDYRGARAGEIVADLQRRYVEWTGWPVKS